MDIEEYGIKYYSTISIAIYCGGDLRVARSPVRSILSCYLIIDEELLNVYDKAGNT